MVEKPQKTTTRQQTPCNRLNGYHNAEAPSLIMKLLHAYVNMYVGELFGEI